MTKKTLIALADVIRTGRAIGQEFEQYHIELLADFCQAQNPRFKRERWLGYIAGNCGKSGGRVKQVN